MAKDDPSYYAMTLRRGETRPIVFVYRPRDKTLAPYNLTGFTVELRIRPEGQAEIVYGTPQISLTNAAAGEITINIAGSSVTAFNFLNAPFAVLLNGERLIHGTLTVKSLYE